MKFLLDTQLIVWAFYEQKRLSPQARSIMEARDNQLTFSAASLWEIAIKRGQGKREFQFDPRILRRTLLDAGYIELPVLGQHSVEVDILPPIHKDPFDRLLAAQALDLRIPLVSRDRVFDLYGVRRIWA